MVGKQIKIKSGDGIRAVDGMRPSLADIFRGDPDKADPIPSAERPATLAAYDARRFAERYAELVKATRELYDLVKFHQTLQQPIALLIRKLESHRDYFCTLPEEAQAKTMKSDLAPYVTRMSTSFMNCKDDLAATHRSKAMRIASLHQGLMQNRA